MPVFIQLLTRLLKDGDDDSIDKNDDGNKPKITDDESNRPGDDAGDVAAKSSLIPSKAPTLIPSLVMLPASLDEPWYNSDAFIVSAVLIGVFLLVGAALKFWWITKVGKTQDLDAAVTSSKSRYRESDRDSDRNDSGGAYEPYNTSASESASLLRASSRDPQGGSGGHQTNNGSSGLPSLGGGAGSKKAVAPFSIGAETPKFSTDDLQAAEEAGLMKKFTVIMAAGVVISLHTTKGPKPVLLSLVGDEVRWQAVKTAQKRYKLNLRDVTYVTQGKTTSNFGRASCADDRLCFSLLTNKTTLDLEASSTLERDCLCKGFKVAVEKSKGIST